ncbi:MAG: acireductone synthase [Pyrinomonadaceae bacterium]
MRSPALLFDPVLKVPLLKSNITCVLLDIEGTSTHIDFVYEVLFPYARAHLKAFLDGHSSDEDVRADVASLRETHAADERERLNPPEWREESVEEQLESVVAYIHWLMDSDRKLTPLKSIQGKVWQSGYRTGELRGHVFPDVPRSFVRWHRQKRDISIFSSGSVLAQKLLFANTEAGDLTRYISGYFDTQMGAKLEAKSYRLIADACGRPASEIMFISDVIAELDAAHLASMHTLLCLRPGNPHPSPEPGHPTIHSFDELFPQSP